MAIYSALLIGGSGGIGTSLCRILVNEGVAVHVAGRNRERLEALAGELDVTTHVCDATRPSEVRQLFEAVAKAEPPLGAVVNLVGSVLLKPAHLTSDEEWHQTMALNLYSSFYAVREGTKVLRKNGGSIVLMSTAAARIGLGNHEAIAAAKAGVQGLAASAAATYAAANIRVNVVAPGLVDTALTKRITRNEASLRTSVGMHPLGRIGDAGDVARAIAFLVNPEQSWITGQVIGVDGGLATVKTK